MACEPFNIFSRRIDVRGVIEVLRGVAERVTVEGPEDDWQRLIVVGRKRMLKKPVRLVVGHDREYYDGPNWHAQILGLANYFNGFPDVPRKDDILRAIRSFRFILAFPECDLDLDSSDERVAWIHALCKHLDGVLFTPTSLRDASGRFLISTDGKSDPHAVLPEIPDSADEDAADEEDDEVDDEEREADPPSAARVARRALALAAVSNRGLIEHEKEKVDDPDEVRELMLQWIEETGITDELEPDEWKALQRPVGSLDGQSAVNAVWRLEGLGVLLWALGRLSFPADDQLVTPRDLFDVVRLGDVEAGRAFIETARLRPTSEIDERTKHLLMLHWRMREFSLRPGAIDFVGLLKRAPLVEVDVSRFSIVDGDLALGGTPISRADAELINACSSAAHERHLALNWLSGGSEIYSETDVST